MRTAIAAAALLAVSAGTPGAQDVETGKASFRKCVLCHSIGENAKNKVGPELNGLDGRSAGALPGFPYSDAHAHSAITWTESTFKQYIKDPQAMVPGTKKAFAGLIGPITEGRGLINAQPQPDGCQLDEGEVVGGELVVAAFPVGRSQA